MTDRDKSILEEPEKMCEYCCNFDKEHIGMDCTALCKLTMTLAYAEDYGGNCMFYNVPKEQIIVPPCKVGDVVYDICTIFDESTLKPKTIIKPRIIDFVSKVGFIIESKGLVIGEKDFGNTIFLTKEEAEAELEKRGKDNG